MEMVRNSEAVYVKFNTLSQYLNSKRFHNNSTLLILLPLTPINTTPATTTNTVCNISAIADIQREFRCIGINPYHTNEENRVSS